jgi:hypothetical protein
MLNLARQGVYAEVFGRVKPIGRTSGFPAWS